MTSGQTTYSTLHSVATALTDRPSFSVFIKNSKKHVQLCTVYVVVLCAQLPSHQKKTPNLHRTRVTVLHCSAEFRIFVEPLKKLLLGRCPLSRAELTSACVKDCERTRKHALHKLSKQACSLLVQITGLHVGGMSRTRQPDSSV